MVLRRLEADSVGLILEWDEESERVALAQAARDVGERDVAYERLIALQRYLRDVGGVRWLDTELTERHRRLCGMGWGMALVWRAEMRSEGGARAVASAVSAGLGTTLEREIE